MVISLQDESSGRESGIAIYLGAYLMHSFRCEDVARDLGVCRKGMEFLGTDN